MRRANIVLKYIIFIYDNNNASADGFKYSFPGKRRYCFGYNALCDGDKRSNLYTRVGVFYFCFLLFFIFIFLIVDNNALF